MKRYTFSQKLGGIIEDVNGDFVRYSEVPTLIDEKDNAFEEAVFVLAERGKAIGELQEQLITSEKALFIANSNLQNMTARREILKETLQTKVDYWHSMYERQRELYDTLQAKRDMEVDALQAQLAEANRRVFTKR